MGNMQDGHAFSFRAAKQTERDQGGRKNLAATANDRERASLHTFVHVYSQPFEPLVKFQRKLHLARRTKEEAQATRDRLIDAAELLFQSQGVSQTSLQQIAERAGATRGAVYWHFKDKADLFNAMMERVTLPFEEAARAAGRDDQVGDRLAAFERVIVGMLRRTATDEQVHRVFDIAMHMVEYTGEMASLRHRHLAARETCIADFTRALTLAARHADVRLPIPARAAAQGLHALLSGFVQNWLLEPSAFDLVRAGRRSLRVYLAGLGFGDNGKLPRPRAGSAATRPSTLSRCISTDRIRPSEG